MCYTTLHKDVYNALTHDKNLAPTRRLERWKLKSQHAYLVCCELFVSWASLHRVYTTYLRCWIPVLAILVNVLKTASHIFLGPLTEGSSSKNACTCVNKRIAATCGGVCHHCDVTTHPRATLSLPNIYYLLLQLTTHLVSKSTSVTTTTLLIICFKNFFVLDSIRSARKKW